MKKLLDLLMTVFAGIAVFLVVAIPTASIIIPDIVAESNIGSAEETFEPSVSSILVCIERDEFSVYDVMFDYSAGDIAVNKLSNVADDRGTLNKIYDNYGAGELKSTVGGLLGKNYSFFVIFTENRKKKHSQTPYTCSTI